MLDINKIYNCNCLDGLRCLDSDIIDLTVTSPPYDNLRDYNGYVFDFENIARELYRVTKPGGTVVWVVGDATIDGSESGTSFTQALFFKSIGFWLYDTMIYRKQNFMPLSHRRYEQEFEYMFVLTKGKPTTFNPIMIPCKYAGTENWGTQSFYKTSGELVHTDKKSVISEEKPHGNIWVYRTGSIVSEGLSHPAPFPEQLALDQIASWSNQDDLVLDPFMGSGTTALAAARCFRNFMGFEISSEYCTMIDQRLSDYGLGGAIASLPEGAIMASEQVAQNPISRPASKPSKPAQTKKPVASTSSLGFNCDNF